MTQPTDDTLPKFFKDDSGYCYIATPHLAGEPGLTAWDGKVDSRGFALEDATEQPAEPSKGRSRARREPVQSDTEGAEE